MHITFLGNTCNNSYNIAKAMIAAGHTCKLYYDPTFHPQTFPETEDPELAERWPSWIHKLTPQDKTAHPYAGPSSRFLRQLSKTDIIHCEGGYLLWAHKTGRPYFWFPFGQDCNYFLKWSFWTDMPNPSHMANSLRFMSAALGAGGINYAQGLSNRAYFKNFMQNYYSGYIGRVYFPINVEKFSPKQSPSIDELLRAKGIDKRARGLLVFNPTRIMFTPQSDYDYGSNLLLEALAELKKKHIDFTLFLCERGIADEELFKKIASNLGIAENLIWLPFIPRAELPQWYNACHIATNDFRPGGLGSICLESMSCGTPLLSCMLPQTDPTYVKGNYTSEPPIYNSNPLSSAVEAFMEAALEPSMAAERGRQCRQWILDNLSYEAVAPKFMEAYESSIAAFSRQRSAFSFPPMPAGELELFLQKLRHDSMDIQHIGWKLDEYPTDPHLLGLLVTALQHAGNPLAAVVLTYNLRELGMDIDTSLYRIPLRDSLQGLFWAAKDMIKRSGTLAPFVSRAKNLRDRLRGTSLQ